MQVNSFPELNIQADYDDLCSPVEVVFTTDEGYNKYTWNFGDGVSIETENNQANHSYIFNYSDHIIDPDTTFIDDEEGLEFVDNKSAESVHRDTLYFTRHDTIYNFTLIVETIHGCSDSITQAIPVYPQPKADFFVAPVLSYYPDSYS